MQKSFSFYLDCSVERWGGRRNIEQNCKRQRQNPRQKWKNRKTFWGARQGIDLQLSKLRFEAIVDVFLSRLVLAWRGGASFLTSYIASFGSTATSLFKIRTPAWSSTSISRFHRGIFFPFFIQRTFHEQRFFRKKEIPRVNFVKWAM